MNVSYTINRALMPLMLHYQLIAECTSSAAWKTGRQKRLLETALKSQPYCKAYVGKVVATAKRWVTKGCDDSITMEFGELMTWRLLYDVCMEVWGTKE